MPVIKCMVSRVYCGPKFEKHRLHKDETMTIEPGQISFFKKLIASKAIVVLDGSVEDTAPAIEPVEVKDAPVPQQVPAQAEQPASAIPEPKGIVMPSINPNTNLKKNKKSRHKKKHK